MRPTAVCPTSAWVPAISTWDRLCQRLTKLRAHGESMLPDWPRAWRSGWLSRSLKSCRRRGSRRHGTASNGRAPQRWLGTVQGLRPAIDVGKRTEARSRNKAGRRRRGWRWAAMILRPLPFGHVWTCRREIQSSASSASAIESPRKSSARVLLSSHQLACRAGCASSDVGGHMGKARRPARRPNYPRQPLPYRSEVRAAGEHEMVQWLSVSCTRAAGLR